MSKAMTKSPDIFAKLQKHKGTDQETRKRTSFDIG